MSYLEPPKHGGGGGEPDKKKLHRIFLYFKFSRIVMIACAVFFVSNWAYSGLIVKDYVEEPKMFYVVPVDDNTVYNFFLVSTVMHIIAFTYIMHIYNQRFKRAKYMHLAYCTCDRKRWYNR